MRGEALLCAEASQAQATSCSGGGSGLRRGWGNGGGSKCSGGFGGLALSEVAAIWVDKPPIAY